MTCTPDYIASQIGCLSCLEDVDLESIITHLLCDWDGGGGGTNFLILEDGSRILLEDGGRIKLETAP